ncbi:MAG TPA: sugar ABC transporter ATP-binding protein [Chloroflexota bacterium]|nr:sugar ABC transporter ATP-binding protein [Chloroflexota bacterium]
MLLELRGLRKRYGETQALDGLDLTATSGEILAIAGPNGAGKSTMIRILAGETSPDAGQILIDGQPWSAGDRRHQIAVVHQEPQLFPTLTVAENLLVGREGTRLARPHAAARESSVLANLRITPFADMPLEACSLVTRQLTEIGRALIHEARIFLFDEPNSALTEEESDRLFQYVHALKRDGHVVILVTHRLHELVTHADRVAIIREGRCTSLLSGGAMTQEAVAEQLVVGEREREARGQAIAVQARQSRPMLRLAGWTQPGGAFTQIALQVDGGEIVALMGVEGSGVRELLRSVAGLVPAQGEIAVAGFAGRRAARALIAYLAADRRLSLFSNLSVGENLVARLGAPDIATPRGALRPRALQRLAADLIARYRIRTQSATQPIRALSGGNQQKVALAASIARRPQVLALEEPTRGVDIHTKAEIYQLLRAFCQEGKAVLVLCTEASEVFDLADRVFVVEHGFLSPPIDVRAHERVETLAADITRLESHRQAPPPVAGQPVGAAGERSP